MSYIKYFNSKTIYQGESFTKTIIKDGGETWNDEDSSTFELKNQDGLTVASGTLEKTLDKKGFILVLPFTDTDNLDGKYSLFVYLTNELDPRIREIIVEYILTIKKV